MSTGERGAGEYRKSRRQKAVAGADGRSRGFREGRAGRGTGVREAGRAGTGVREAKGLPSPQEEERKRRALALRRRRKEAFAARLTLLLVVYAACCLIIAGFVFSLYRKGGSGAAHTLVVADGEGKALCRLSAEEANIGGVEYISASALSRLYSFTLAGDKEQVNMYFFDLSPAEKSRKVPLSGDPGGELRDAARSEKLAGRSLGGDMTYENIRLFKNSAVLEMNGSNIRLSAKIIFTDDYYIPLELIENYFSGAIIERKGGEVTLSRNESARFTLRLHDPRL